MGLAVLLIMCACIAGCTTPTSIKSVTTPVVPVSTTLVTVAGTTPVATQAPVSGTAASTTTETGTGIGTTISVHYNDYSCINIPETLGVPYLYPGEKYEISAGSAGSGTISPNLLVLDVTDYHKFGTTKPVWDSVQKTWVYDGVVPLVKIIDVATWQTKTLAIEDQGYYYICIDDRKETGTSEAVYQVPVKVTRT